MKFLFFFLLFSFSLLHAEKSDYQFGQGLQIGTLPLYIGGYFSVEYKDGRDNTRSLELDELALMLYGEKDNFSYMLELEAEDVYKEVFGDTVYEERQEGFHLERIYVKYDFNEKYAMTLGKFNSPIGFWNQNPINVLQDTSSKPLVTTLLFPRFTSGLEVEYQSLDNDFLRFTSILQEGEDFDKIFYDEIYNNFEVNRHYGAGVSLENAGVKYKVNVGYFRETTGEDYGYLLAAFQYNQEQYRIQGEFGTQRGDTKEAISFVGYLQGVYEIAEHHEAILRVESFHIEDEEFSDTFAVLGYTYRPYYPVALKAEYQRHTLDEENKFILSFSVLF